MAYRYEDLREELLTDDGQRLFLAVRDNVRKLMEKTDAITMTKAAALPPGVGAAESCELMACVDRMLELGELIEYSTWDPRGVDRLFIRTWK